MTNENKGRILVADDEVLIRNIYRKFFGMKFPEFNMEEFSNGNSLDARLKEETFDIRLILADNTMPPGFTGSEIIKKYALRFSQIPFILCYAGLDDIGRTAVENGAFSYLKKPFELSVFADLVERAIDYSNHDNFYKSSEY